MMWKAICAWHVSPVRAGCAVPYVARNSPVATWKSIDLQKAWAVSTAGEAVKKQIKALAAGPVYEDVVLFSEDPASVLGAEVVELVSWIHPTANMDDDRKNKVKHGFSKFQKAISTHSPEADGGLVAGWGQVEFDHAGVPSRRFTSFIGWKSVDAHYKCKETPPFTENIHWLAENGDTGVEMVHYPDFTWLFPSRTDQAPAVELDIVGSSREQQLRRQAEAVFDNPQRSVFLNYNFDSPAALRFPEARLATLQFPETAYLLQMLANETGELA
ncbi:hypothetical protein HRG_009992 [Hirsutella rhossiliensis]|uniref:Uncharacterized protein n=1 Tax=Hirsutella rhossiliensis TaxID=111463 RepID=A0A9P8MTJ7_9HYPO|nr:uncharacterized protein HRG_09992 [Hirsutella rhossiliensis]KAH0958947.1 hypothetical protein HRG_09992 [Hirsutella rhossiliensis]